MDAKCFKSNVFPRHDFSSYAYNQSHKPVREQDEVVVHTVRAMYLYCAMADVAAETNDENLAAACERLWKSLTKKRRCITGGVGQTAKNEGFTFDYDLPNETAYAETCAAGRQELARRPILSGGAEVEAQERYSQGDSLLLPGQPHER